MKKTIATALVALSATLALTGCSPAQPVAAPTPTVRELSANPSWPKNCYIDALLKDMPYLTFGTEAGEDGAILLDGRNGRRLGCISDPNGEYGDNVLTWPTTFNFDKTTDTFDTWDKFIREGVKDGSKYIETSISGCKVIYNEYVPEGGKDSLTQAFAYCNGLTVDFWMPRPWKASQIVMKAVLDSVS